MPYKDPEKRRAKNRAYLARLRAEEPERVREYQKRWKESLTDEQRAEMSAKYAEWTRRIGRVNPETEYVPLGRRSSRNSREEFLADASDPRHGTRNGYINLKCRCDRCRTANSVAMAEYKARKRGT